MYERRKSEVNVRGDGRASHVSDSDVVVIKVFEGRVRAGGEREQGLQRRMREFSGTIRRERGGGTGRGWDEDEEEDDEGRERGRFSGQRCWG